MGQFYHQLYRNQIFSHTLAKHCFETIYLSLASRGRITLVRQQISTSVMLFILLIALNPDGANCATLYIAELRQKGASIFGKHFLCYLKLFSFAFRWYSKKFLSTLSERRCEVWFNYIGNNKSINAKKFRIYLPVGWLCVCVCLLEIFGKIICTT